MGSRRRRRVTKRRFAAKLLFQWRVVVKGRSNKRRLCEERIILIRTTSAAEAHRLALKTGRAGEFHYMNHARNPVRFEFVGILDLLELGIECLPDEAWYDIKYMYTPKERAKRIVPAKRKLNALYWERFRATSNNRSRGP